jgi:hypothetical protein
MRNFVNTSCEKRDNIRIYDTYQLSMVSVISVNSVKNFKDPLFCFQHNHLLTYHLLAISAKTNYL